MLSPGTRSLLTDALRPPVGFRVDAVVATTYSLDLTALLLAPLSFALSDHRVDDGGNADPIAVLDALRRYAARTTVFCQPGAIHHLERYRPILQFAEDSVVQVQAPTPNRVFHPKIWLARFTDLEGRHRHRLLCLSRNLTFDRSWDTILRLDEEEAEQAGAGQAAAGGPDPAPLADFVRRLPELAIGTISSDRLDTIDDVARSVSSARFAVPPPFHGLVFLPLGMGDGITLPFPGRADRLVAVSAFLDTSTSRMLSTMADDVIVLSRPESFDRVGAAAFGTRTRTCVLQRAAEVGLGEEPQAPRRTLTETGQVPDGLHAKTFVLERGRVATVVTGSANATAAGFDGNVEFDVALEGPRSTCGVTPMWQGDADSPGLFRLTEPYPIGTEHGSVDAESALDWEAERFHADLAAAVPELHLAHLDDGRTSLRLVAELPKSPGTSRIWPVSLPREVHAVALDPAQDIVWGPIALSNVTPFLAVETTIGRHRRTGVIKATLVGDVPGRRQDALRDVLRTQLDVLRYLIFLLGDPAYDQFLNVLDGGENEGWNLGRGRTGPELALFEPLVRAAARDDGSLGRVAGIIADLREMENGAALVPDGFEMIWDAVWQFHRERTA